MATCSHAAFDLCPLTLLYCMRRYSTETSLCRTTATLMEGAKHTDTYMERVFCATSCGDFIPDVFSASFVRALSTPLLKSQRIVLISELQFILYLNKTEKFTADGQAWLGISLSISP